VEVRVFSTAPFPVKDGHHPCFWAASVPLPFQGAVLQDIPVPWPCTGRADQGLRDSLTGLGIAAAKAIICDLSKSARREYARACTIVADRNCSWCDGAGQIRLAVASARRLGLALIKLGLLALPCTIL
jgi:hypothetical protein